jgi:tyrosine-protein phosphatase YwqE
MFEFLKPKPKTAIPTFASLGIDIHCHMLPGVDDGSKSNEESLACLKVMRDAGFEKVICTPHYQYPRFPNVESDIQNRYDSMLLDFTSLNAQNIPQMIGVAGEYRVDSGFSDRIKNNQFLLVGGKYLLTEFSLHQQVIGLDQVMFDLQMKNYEIILAHPERYPYYSSASSKLQHLKDMGVYFQVNILSLIGFYGEGPRRKAFEMIEKGWVEFLGTDMHNTLYAQALIDATHDRKIIKLIEKHQFLNSQVESKEPIKTNKI